MSRSSYVPGARPPGSASTRVPFSTPVVETDATAFVRSASAPNGNSINWSLAVGWEIPPHIAVIVPARGTSVGVTSR
jgi:hypothetical protein